MVVENQVSTWPETAVNSPERSVAKLVLRVSEEPKRRHQVEFPKLHVTAGEVAVNEGVGRKLSTRLGQHRFRDVNADSLTGIWADNLNQPTRAASEIQVSVYAFRIESLYPFRYFNRFALRKVRIQRSATNAFVVGRSPVYVRFTVITPAR